MDGKEVIKEDDPELVQLREAWGTKITDKVAREVLLLHEVNPSGRYAESRAWVHARNARMTCSEMVETLVEKLDLSNLKIKKLEATASAKKRKKAGPSYC